jgi:hypothetical protein
MTDSLKSIENRIKNLEKLKQIASYRYSQNQTSDLKELIELEKLSLSTDRQELIKSLKRESLMRDCLMKIAGLKNIEALEMLKICLTEIIIETGLDNDIYQELLNSVRQNEN